MATNLALDDDLINEAKALGGFKTKKEAVTAALEEYVQRRSRPKIVEAFGTVEYLEGFDPIAQRRWERNSHWQK